MTTNQNTQTIHELTMVEIARQTKIHAARLRQICDERWAIAKNPQPGDLESPMVADDERAAREHAKTLLNGSAPDSLSLPPELSRDKILLREKRALEIVLDILSKKELVARASAAVEWAEANCADRLSTCREIVLGAIRLDALEDHARQQLGKCPDIFAVGYFPMVNIIGGRSITEIPLSDLVKSALADGVVTQAEIRKAKNVG